MPSTYAHRRFGADVLNALDPETASLVTDRRLYDIGLHGPDVLFYYDVVHPGPVRERGMTLHDLTGAEVLFPSRRQVKGLDPEMVRSYPMGFLCHYVLDSEYHPYITRWRSVGSPTPTSKGTWTVNCSPRTVWTPDTRCWHRTSSRPRGTRMCWPRRWV